MSYETVHQDARQTVCCFDREREIEAEYMETRSFLEIVSVSLIYGSPSICMRMIQFSQSKTRIERIFSGER